MVIPLRPPLRFCGVNLTPKRWRSKRSPFVSSIAVLRWKSHPKALAFETTLPLRFCGGNLTEKRWTFAPPAPLLRFLVNSQRPRPNPTVLYHKPLKMDPVFWKTLKTECFFLLSLYLRHSISHHLFISQVYISRPIYISGLYLTFLYLSLSKKYLSLPYI